MVRNLNGGLNNSQKSSSIQILNNIILTKDHDHGLNTGLVLGMVNQGAVIQIVTVQLMFMI